MPPPLRPTLGDPRHRTRIRSTRVHLPDGEAPATIVIADGTIRDIQPHTLDLTAPTLGDTDLLDLGDTPLLPGLIDAHVHLNDPGRADWEGLETGTRAAAAAGLTHLIDMPLNSEPVTTSVAALETKAERARDAAVVHVRFHGGLTPLSHGDLPDLLRHGPALGLQGIKVFLCPSGLDAFPPVTADDLDRAMPLIAEAGLPLLAHAELPLSDPPGVDISSATTWAASRPPAMEREAVALLIDRCRRHRCAVHLVHVADAGCLPLIAKAKAEGLPLTAEACPHHLMFTAADADAAPADRTIAFKCAPPLRDAANRDALRAGLADGTLDLVASDHSPCPSSMKQGGWAGAWGGIAGLQPGPAALHTLTGSVADLVRLMHTGPARVFGLPAGIAVGRPANLTAFDPDTTWTVRGADLHHRHPLTAYEGAALRGRATHTWIDGDLVHHP